jgi:hypothetical protein
MRGWRVTRRTGLTSMMALCQEEPQRRGKSGKSENSRKNLK